MNYIFKERLSEKDAKIDSLTSRLKQRDTPTGSLLGTTTINSIAFYQEREEMPPLSDQLSGARELYLIFFTGSVVNADQKYNVFFKNRQIKLILPDPYYPAFADLCKLFVQDITQMQRDVLTLTTIASKDGVEVRWYKGPIGSSVIIGNPNTPEPWAKMEILVPFGATSERPSFGCRVAQDRKSVV